MIDPSWDAGAGVMDSGPPADAIADTAIHESESDAPADVTADTAPEASDGDDAADSDVMDSPGDGCPAGQSWCGVCTDIVSNPDDCGWCGHACPTGASCNMGICECPAGTDPCSGACVDEATNLQHCGGCGQACAVGASCVGGICECPAGQDACASVCVDEATDTTNCGACGTVCATNAACESGECVCPGQQVVCDGACVDTDTDSTNCGGCGTVCEVGEECKGGACVCLPTWTLCGGTCVDLQADGHNCGACGHDCQGGACDSGWCGPVALGAYDDEPSYLAVDDVYVYWAEWNQRQIWRQAQDGSADPELVADWSAQWAGYAKYIWVDDTNVYIAALQSFSDSDALARTSKAGGGPVEMLGTAKAGSLAFGAVYEGGKFFWTDGDDSGLDWVVRADLPALQPVTLTSDQLGVQGMSLAYRGGYVYWATRDGSNRKVLRVPEDGGAVQTVASNLTSPWKVAVDDDFVYWIDVEGLKRTEVPGTWVETFPAVDAGLVNYTLQGGNLYAASGVGNIWQLRPAIVWPHKWEQRATGQGFPGSIVASDCCVFWVTDTSHAVMKMVK